MMVRNGMRKRSDADDGAHVLLSAGIPKQPEPEANYAVVGLLKIFEVLRSLMRPKSSCLYLFLAQ